ncbi:hypothetical protein DYY67_1999 [Candidatus Nitrosotalea sp. TS]|nr:hypothetical protein [Candidatus Nitrosotalea sp. TS]
MDKLSHYPKPFFPFFKSVSNNSVKGNQYSNTAYKNHINCGKLWISGRPGWDPVTGLGTPIADNLTAALTGGLSCIQHSRISIYTGSACLINYSINCIVQC